jgi:hypothetical protein
MAASAAAANRRGGDDSPTPEPDENQPKTAQRNRPSGKVALCRLEYEGQVYNFGDPVPFVVMEEFPHAVGDKPLTDSDVNRMTKAELAEALRRATGMTTS